MGPRRRVLVAGLLAASALAAAVIDATVSGESEAPPTSAPSATPASTPSPTRVVVAAAPESDPAPEPTSAFTPVPPSPPKPTATSVPVRRAGGGSAPAAEEPAAPALERCDVGGAAGAAQVVVVRGRGQRATVRACSRTADGSYVTDLGPFTGWVGRNGVAPRGAKREGDGRTPSGVFGLRGGFGIRGNPGLPQGWFVVDSADVWVDDPGSSLYNTHQRSPANGRWSSAEPLRNAPAYNYAQVIGYNEGATPGAGSAIFLHVSTGGPTAGCVSLPTSALLAVMRWERSGAVMVIS